MYISQVTVESLKKKVTVEINYLKINEINFRGLTSSDKCFSICINHKSNLKLNESITCDNYAR